MKINEIDILDVMNAASQCRQLNALLENIFERGASGCESNNELIGLAYNLSGKIANYLDRIEEEANQ